MNENRHRFYNRAIKNVHYPLGYDRDPENVAHRTAYHTCRIIREYMDEMWTDGEDTPAIRYHTTLLLLEAMESHSKARNG